MEKSAEQDAWARLSSATDRDAWTVQVKLTYVGSGSKPIPSLVFTTFHHLIDMSWFVPLRRHGLHYGNDDVSIWNFTVAPAEMRSVLAHLPRADDVVGATPCVSLAVVLRQSRLGDCGADVQLDRRAAKAATSTIAAAMDDTNGLALSVLELHRSLLPPA
jgi:hypothetical protein